VQANRALIVDISAVIQEAKLGRARKDAQVDTCGVFAAALFDVLSAQGIPCRMVCATNEEYGGCRWAHLVVAANGSYYDSLGEFSTAIYRKRAKLHPSVFVELKYRKDFRDECYEPEFNEMHAFYVKALKKALCAQMAALPA
jgi:hypothetical protein